MGFCRSVSSRCACLLIAGASILADREARGAAGVETLAGGAPVKPLPPREVGLSPFALAEGPKGEIFLGAEAMVFELRPEGLVRVAGTGIEGFSGDGLTPLETSFRGATDIEVLPDATILVADAGNFRVRRVDRAAARVSTAAGNGKEGYSGEDVPAVDASFGVISDVAVDEKGNFYLADSTSFRVRRVDAETQRVRTVAGNGSFGSGPDGVPAVQSPLGRIGAIAVDRAGNLYLADVSHGLVRRVDAASGEIRTAAGGGALDVAVAEDIPAVQAPLDPLALAVDAAGNLYVADGICVVLGSLCLPGSPASERVRRVDAATGLITTLAGGGDPRDGLGDGGTPREARLASIRDIDILTSGELAIAGGFHHRVRLVDAAFLAIRTLIGNGSPRFSGDSGPPREALFSRPADAILDTGTDTLWIADTGNGRIRLASGVFQGSGGTVKTVAGGGSPVDGVGDGLVPTEARLVSPRAIARDALGRLWIADAGSGRVRRTNPGLSLIETVAGGAAIVIKGPLAPLPVPIPPGGLLEPLDVLPGAADDFWVADGTLGLVLQFDGKAGAAIFAGGGVSEADGVLATEALLRRPAALAMDPAGGILFIADAGSGKVRMVDLASGRIRTIAGGGAPADGAGDGLPATQARLIEPTSLQIEGGGTALWIGDAGAARVRRVDRFSGLIGPLCGSGVEGFAPDGTPALLAALQGPSGISLATQPFPDGRTLVFCDGGNHLVRRVAFLDRSLTIAPASGSLNGGNTVRVSGAGLSSGVTAIFFDGVAALDIVSIDPQSFTATVPRASWPPRTVETAVVVAGDRDSIPGGYTYLNDPPVADPDADDPDDGYRIFLGDALALDGRASLDPNEPSGDAIALFEWDLNADGAADAVGAAPVLSPEQLAAIGISSGGTYAVNLRVFDREGASAERSTSLAVFDYKLDPPSGSLNGGSAAFIRGTNLRGIRGVLFDSAPAANLVLVDDATLQLTVPPHKPPAGEVEVVLVFDALELPLKERFTYLNDPPIARAIADAAKTGYRVRLGSALVLDGTASMDPNEPVGDSIVSFEWDLDSDGRLDRRGAKVKLSPEEVKTLARGVGILQNITLRVVDSMKATGADTVPLTVLPVAVAFPNDDFKDWTGDKNANKIDDRIDARLDGERVDLVVLLDAGADLRAAALRFRPLSLSPPLELPAISALCLKGVLVSAVKTTLAAEPQLFRVEEEEQFEVTLDISTAALRAAPSAPYSPFTARDRGLDGDGVNIAFLDSGVDDDHAALAGKFVAGFNAFSDDPSSSGHQSNPDDDLDFGAIFHGTHMAGIALGSDATYAGVAPGAKIIDVKVLNSLGRGSSASVMGAIQWCINNKNFAWTGQPARHHGIDIINLSLGSKVRSDGKDALSIMVNAAVSEGLIVVAACGNTSSLGSGFGTPAAADGAITVGGSNDQGTVDRADDAVMANSNFGPRLSDGDDDQIDELKPDVIAPGSGIHSPIGNIAGLPAVGFSTVSGTSASAAHVSGMAALIIEEVGTLSPQAVKALIRNGAEPRGSPFDPYLDASWNTHYGRGLADAFRSLPDDLGPVDAVWSANSIVDSLHAIAPDPSPAPASSFLAGSPFGIGGSREPVGIAVDGGGNVWLANRGDASVVKLSSAGSVRFRAPLGPTLGAVAGTDLFGIAVDAAGDAWVTLKSANRLARIRGEGVVDLTSFLVGSQPVAVAVDSSGNLWVANSAGNSVTKLDSTGVEAAGSPFPAGLKPSAVACDRAGRAYVANRDSNDVTILAADGSPVGNFPAGVQPIEIALDFDGRIWVANDLQSVVTRLDADGSNPTPFSVLVAPRGITVAGDGTIWVSTYTAGIGDSLVRLRPDGVQLEGVLVDYGPLNHGDGSGFAHANVVDPQGDADRDGWTNAEEISAHTNPLSRASHPVEVSTIFPASGPVSGGNRVRIEGRGIAPPVEVRIAGTPAGNMSLVVGGVEVEVPPGAFPPAGAVDVEVRRPEAPAFTVAGGYTYLNGDPVADPDPDNPNDGYVITVGDSLALDGSESSDPDEPIGDSIVLYEWNLNGNVFAGASQVLSAATLAGYGLAAPGEYPLSLTVEDSLGAQDTRTTSVFLVAPGAPQFLRGNANQDRGVDIADAVYLIQWLFLAGAEPPCLDAANANGDSSINIADAIYELNHLFLGGPPIPAPYPACGIGAPILGCDATSCP